MTQATADAEKLMHTKVEVPDQTHYQLRVLAAENRLSLRGLLRKLAEQAAAVRLAGGDPLQWIKDRQG